MSPTPWFTLLAAAAAAAFAGCGKHEESDNDRLAATEQSASEESGASQESDPCTLLEAAEVEAAIGALAVPPYREGVNGPDAMGDKCTYQTKDLHRIVLAVTWTEGAMVMKMLGMPAAVADQAGMRGRLPLPDGVTVTGEWDEAKALSCCEITALRGDSVVAIDFRGTDLTTAQGTGLLNAALRRLDSPLKNVDGAAAVAAARQREEAGTGRPKPVPACSLITAADAAALLGPVDTLPQSSDHRCEYRSKTQPKLLSFSVGWTNGYLDYRSDREIADKAMSALFGEKARDPGAAAAPAAQYSGPWEHADLIALDFVAVRGDVIMHIDMRGTKLDDARALMAIAMNRISWPPKS